MKIVIFYTIMNREYQNACLLKAELIKRGYEVYIVPFLSTYKDSAIFKGNIDFTPDLVLIPCLYRKKTADVLGKIFKEKVSKVINLQYEQILSEKHKENNLQLPHGKMVNAIHICWNEQFRQKLIENNVPNENAIVTGSLNIDLCRERFFSVYKTKNDLAIENKLNPNKKWILFVSSFVFANPTESWLNFHYNHEDWDKERVDKRVYFDSNSRKIILEWIKKYLKDNDCEFIYRQHPSEQVNEELYEIENEFDNFHIIGEDSIRTWIKNCDKIHTWMSTSIAEIYFMQKNCSILRPIDIPDDISIKILQEGKFIRNYEDFCDFNNTNKDYFPIDKDLILDEFYIDEEKYAYELICDVIENTLKNDIKMDIYEN